MVHRRTGRRRLRPGPQRAALPPSDSHTTRSTSRLERVRLFRPRCLNRTDRSQRLARPALPPTGENDPVLLKDFIASFATENTGPVAMFNFLSYMPDGGREKYFGYIQVFQSSTGIKYGGEPLFLGMDVTGWSSKDTDEKKQERAGWVNCALDWYPSLWHFGKMLDDPGYAEADRTFKQGVIRDNPLLCCTEVDIGYVDH